MMDNDDILSVLQDYLHEADNDNIDFETPLDYYLGNPNGREIEGRSKVTSTDVADAIEWIMPQIMKSFTQNNEVVIFDPIHPGDETQAELESEFVYEVLMKENNGFVNLHQMTKDALIQQNGFMKVFYEDKSDEVTNEYSGLTPQEYQVIMADPRSDIIEQELAINSETGFESYNCKVVTEIPNGKICVESVPPEQVLVNTDHSSIVMDDAKFIAHIQRKTVSQLIQEGYDEETLLNASTGDEYNETEYRFQAQGEVTYDDPENPVDPSQREINIAECYLKIDINEDGISEYAKITAIGYHTPTEILDVDELDYCPWVSVTGILMSHKLRGLSIFDRLKEIQDQKTTLWRNMFDNIYLQNNQRHTVIEGQVNMDDLLVSRPGGLIRVKRQDAIAPLQTPQMGDDIKDMMQYLDVVRAGRVGVSPEGEAAPHQIGERVGSEGVDRLMTAKEELVGLIVRVVAETGIKPICLKIRELSCRHYDSIRDFQFRGQWMKIQPSQWMDRYKCTVRVGTGSGNHERQVVALREIIALQEKIVMQPGQYITDQKKVFDTLDDFCKFSGLNGATRYFIDPASQEGMQKKQQSEQQAQQQQQMEQQMQGMMAQAQMKLADAENKKAEAQTANVQLKAQVDIQKNQLTAQKQGYEAEIKMLQQQLTEAQTIADTAGKSADRDLKKYEIDQKTALELTKLESDKQSEENANFKENQSDVAA